MTTAATSAALRSAVHALCRYAATRQEQQQPRPHHSDDDDDDYVAELRRLHDATQQTGDATTTSSTSSRTTSPRAFLPALSLRVRDPLAEDVRQMWCETTKAMELSARFALVDEMDRVYTELSRLLQQQQQQQPQSQQQQQQHILPPSSSPPPPRTQVTMREYLDVLDALAAWRRERDDDTRHTSRTHTCDATASVSPSVAAVLSVLSSSPSAHATADVSDNDDHNNNNNNSNNNERGATCRRDDTALTTAAALGERLYITCVAPRWPDAELFLSCMQSNNNSSNSNSNSSHHGSEGSYEASAMLPHSGSVCAMPSSSAIAAEAVASSAGSRHATAAAAEARVDVAALCDAYAKHVALLRCEAELLLYDSNHDGRLAEDEVEAYVRALVPRVAALRDLSDELLPFYCCTASRRLFHELDAGNRGVLRIDALVRCCGAVMDEWLSLQLARDDCALNWFSASVTQHVYDKFVLLDTRNASTLSRDNMLAYKKGLPTVVDDGLPRDRSPLSALFIERFFETRASAARGEVDYRTFVDFVLAVELLPQCRQPLFFWRLLDVHETGVLTPLTVHGFFRETHATLVSAGLHVPPRETVLRELFDLITTAAPLRITRDEFVRAPQAGLFVALVIDCLSFWAYESREQR